MDNREKVSVFCEIMAEKIIIGIVFLLPLYFSFYKDNSVFNLPKASMFIIAMNMLAILTIGALFFSRKLLIGYNKILFCIIISYLVVLGLSTLFSLNPEKSFWGTYWRHQGLLLHLYYALFFFFITFFIRRREQVFKIFDALIFSSLLVSIIGLLQWLGADIYQILGMLPATQMSLTRVYSTIGQPTFLGSFLVLTIFITPFRLYYAQGLFRKFLFSFVISAQFLCLVVSYSRGAWMGFIFGCIILIALLILIRFKGASLKKLVLGFVIFLFAILTIFSYFVLISKEASYGATENFIIARFKSSFNMNYGSGAMRIRVYTAALDLVSKSPFFGYGIETADTLFLPYILPDWSIYENLNTIPDRSHNEFLDILIFSGPLALLFFMIIVASVFYHAVKYIDIHRSDDAAVYLALVVSGMAGYLVSMLSVFSITETSMIFWAFLATVLVLSESMEVRRIELNRTRLILFSPFALAVVFLSIHFSIIYIKSLVADRYFYNARVSAQSQDYAGMFTNVIRAMEYNPRELFYQTFFINEFVSSIGAVQSDVYKDSILSFFESYIEDHKDETNNYENMQRIAQIASILGIHKDQKYFEYAESIYSELTAKYPFITNLYISWARANFDMKYYKKSVALYKQALSTLPADDDPRLSIPDYGEHKQVIQTSKNQIYLLLYMNYMKLGDLKQAEIYLQKILRNNPYLVDIYGYLGDIYMREKKFDEAINSYKRGGMLDTESNFWNLKLANTYLEKKDYTNAQKFIDIAYKKDNVNNQIKDLRGQIYKHLKPADEDK